MNSTELYQFFYDLVTGLLPGIEVIATHDNGPSPTGNHITVSIDGNWKLIGSAPARLAEDKTLISPRVYHYSVDVELREVDGHGDNLRTILESFDTQDSKDIFRAAGVAVLRPTGPEFLPRLESSNWRREYLLRLNLNVARGDSGDSNYIETVEFTNNLGGT